VGSRLHLKGNGPGLIMMIDKPGKPFYYENRYFVIRLYRRNQVSVSAPEYIGEQKSRGVSRENARQFSSADSAKRAVAQFKRCGMLFEIEEIVDRRGTITPFPDFINDLLEQIPSPYCLVAMEWYFGGDIKNYFLTSFSKSSYYRYRSKLLEFGIDISKKSDVILLGQETYCN
jgi:hypothetical protein